MNPPLVYIIYHHLIYLCLKSLLLYFFVENGVFLFICTILIVLTVVVTQWHSTRYPNHTFVARKILHVVSVGLCSYVIHMSEGGVELVIIFLIAAALLAYEVSTKRLNISQGNSYGIALFPFAFGLLLFIGLNHMMVALGGYVLTFSDALAGLIGRKFGSRFFIPFKEEKSILGSITFFIATSSILWYLNWFGLSLLEIAFVAFCAMIAEMYSWKGSDNLSIVMVVALSIWVFS